MSQSLRIAAAATCVAVALAPAAVAELSRDDRRAAEDMLEKGTLYMRVDTPCATGRHPYGTYKRPLVEVSPEGEISTEAEEAINASWWHADSTYWGVRVNDPVELDELDYEEDENTVEIELEGVGPIDGEDTVVLFVDIHTFEDFQKAFERTFSYRPLQEEHDDWPQEIKDAIAERRLVEGMTKRQAYYVTGRPEGFDRLEEGGEEVEIWRLRQTKGTKMGFFTVRSGEETGLPEKLRFEDGVLVDLGGGESFSLD